ncbi:MAG: CsiV family protein [Gammaproteobacteria bacterium]|nr:CsiV family protein [Gammaproteobacteria bacterium]
MKRTLLTLLAMSSALANAQDNVQDWLSKNWYATEVIVFQRGPVMENSAIEKLVLRNVRRFPFEVRALIPPPDAIESFYSLDPFTRATLEFPTFDINLDEFSFLVFTEPPVENKNESPDDFLDEDVPPDAEPGQPRSHRVPMPPSSKPPPIIEPVLGGPPPVIEPILEPHPLLDFLAMLSSFERSLDEQSYRWLPTSELLMQTEANRIERQDDLHILMHGRWIQPVPERTQPEPLLVQQGALIGNTRQLEGTMAVTLGRYLHFQATLWYREPALGQQPVDIPLGEVFLGGSSSARFDQAVTLPDPGAGYMMISQSRRLRSTEVHYLDHPKIGIIVRIDPVTIPPELASGFEALEETDE